MESILTGLVVALVMFILGKITSDMNSSKKYDEIERRHKADQEMWVGMFKMLSEKLDALNDSINQNNLISASKVSSDKFEATIAKVYESLNEVREKINSCLGCKNYEKRG